MNLGQQRRRSPFDSSFFKPREKLQPSAHIANEAGSMLTNASSRPAFSAQETRDIGGRTSGNVKADSGKNSAQPEQTAQDAIKNDGALNSDQAAQKLALNSNSSDALHQLASVDPDKAIKSAVRDNGQTSEAFHIPSIAKEIRAIVYGPEVGHS